MARKSINGRKSVGRINGPLTPTPNTGRGARKNNPSGHMPPKYPMKPHVRGSCHCGVTLGSHGLDYMDYIPMGDPGYFGGGH